jgi:uncharacterized protein YutE (UPF0331/DUF86 family)
MPDVVLNKLQTIERCLKRIREEYEGYEEEFNENFTKQDSVILNLERASQASIDIATHIVKSMKLGLPQSSRELFVLLEAVDIIDVEISQQMQNMVGFRNITVHDYQNLNIEIVVSIVEKHLSDFEIFNRQVIENFIV